MPDFKQILDTPGSAIEPPKIPPVGTYKARVGTYKLTESRENKTPGLQFTNRLTGEYKEDVDETELQEFGGAAKLMSRDIQDTFWMSPDAQFRFKQWCSEALGIEGVDEMTIRQMADEAKNREVWVNLGHRTANRNDGSVATYLQVNGYARVED